ncbi:MAG TPA: pyocin knob domain-containing protein [Pseudomonas sp.]|nr:pyocin knob domain-containing protein [Pseudomonas sp.]
MDRQIVYPGQILPETSLLQMAKDSMIGLAKLSAAVLGTSTMANGFAVTPTGPASLQVVCAPGEIYSLTSIDALAFSTLPADTTHSIMKQGILLDGVTLSCPAPGTTGQSINYLVQVTYQDSDSTPVLLPYYNSANPALPFSGMGNNGLTQNTNRKGIAVVNVKAGASAATGSQVTPAPDAGYVGLYVVTVAFGQSTITAGSIAKYSGAPLLPAGLIQSMQNSQTTTADDTGVANAYAANFTPAITSLVDKMQVCIKALNANTTASTFTPAPGVITARPILRLDQTALQGGEIVADSRCSLIYSSALSSWILLYATGGAPSSGITLTDGTTDFNTITRAGRFSKLLGAAPGSRNANHPDGQLSGPGAANFYYLDVSSFGGNVTQWATPYLSANGFCTPAFRTLATGVWSNWRKVTTSDDGGRLINVQTFTASGTYTPTPGMTSVIIELQGGGGSGGGATVPSAGNVSLGAPGAAGSYGEWRLFAASIGASQPVTIGAAGTAGSGVAGGNGGTTSVGALVSAPGGVGGSVLNNQVPPQYNGNGTASSNPTGASISYSLGVAGAPSAAPVAGSGTGGLGGSSKFGAGGLGSSINSVGNPSPNYGAGGAGCVCGSGGVAITGALGKAGIAIFREYS